MPDVNRGDYKAGEFRSVFEADLDSIAGSDGASIGQEQTRWKFKGPWLAGQTEGDFNAFVSTEVRKRKAEFQKYLKTACAKSLTADARQAAEGEMLPAIEESEVTAEQFTEFVRGLRNTRSELYRLIRDFLDLPPAPSASVNVADALIRGERFDEYVPTSPSPYANTGPPKTHPSAGLAYSLTSAHTYNHPVWGPQKNPPPISSRIVKPKGASTGAFGATLGVGGFVTDLPVGSDSFNIASNRFNKVRTKDMPGTLHIDPNKVGGSKMWVHPTNARIDPKGRVIMTVEAGDPESIAVHEGTTDQIPVVETPKLASRTFSMGAPPSFDNLGSSRYSGVSRGYGLDFNAVRSNQDSPRRETPAQRNDPLSQLTGL